MNCIDAVLGQSYLPHTLYVIDNASTDGTEEQLIKKGFHNTVVKGVTIQYVRLQKNSGGAGGFHTGMKLAYENGCNAVWVMDDDGIPDKDCLKNLLAYIGQYDYVSPMVISVENEEMMSFAGCWVKEFVKQEEKGVVKGSAYPFNGILYSRKLIETIGLPKKEMFIWGDEVNYHFRAITKGLQPITVVNAIHRHPLNRQRYVKYFGKHMMVVPAEEWKLFYYLRNRTYNSCYFCGRRSCIKQALTDLLKFSCYFILQAHQPSKISIVLKAIIKGFYGNFSVPEELMS